jgi:hypothetical protein
VELELRVESRRSSREATAQRSAAASRVLVVGLSVRAAFGATLGRTMRLFVMLVVGRVREAAAPSRVCHEASLEPSSSVRDAYYGPLFFTCTHFEAPGINVNPATTCEVRAGAQVSGSKETGGGRNRPVPHRRRVSP